ncbi:hypothetical protein [Luteolibacter sp. Populi]|uniref:hypothetical protein n=1 Tax=Luteolibacter sp. Populi TaxID=3230487 RepID=UPI003466275F
MKTPYSFVFAGLIAVPVLLAQNPADPSAASPGSTGSALGSGVASNPFIRQNLASPAAEDDNGARNLSVCMEVFSVDLADAASLQRSGISDAALYQKLVERVAGGSAAQEQFSVVRARSGEKATLETITEFIYPTEYIPGNGEEAAHTENPEPNEPPAATVKPASDPVERASEEPAKAAPALGTAFETRNAGTTLEIEPTLGADNQIIDLRIAPESVNLADRIQWGQGISQVEMPVFETQRVVTALTVRAGIPGLLGTPSRPPASKLDPDAKKRVWFSFVTVSVIRV